MVKIITDNILPCSYKNNKIIHFATKGVEFKMKLMNEFDKPTIKMNELKVEIFCGVEKLLDGKDYVLQINGLLINLVFLRISKPHTYFIAKLFRHTVCLEQIIIKVISPHTLVQIMRGYQE